MSERNGICIFAPVTGDHVNYSVVSELLTAAHSIRDGSEEPIQVIVAAPNCVKFLGELESMPVDNIYAADTKDLSLFSDDAKSAVIADMLRRVAPNCVLIPANDEGRSVFPRVAIKLNTGLTADCTLLKTERRENGESRVRQNKPSFGDNVMVDIVNRDARRPQMMTIRQGVYKPFEEPVSKSKKPEVCLFDDICVPKSGVWVLEMLPRSESADELLSASTVVVAGRGALEGDNIELLKAFSQKIGGALGGTRPLADEGIIPFESQIGQTGRTIRPEVCLSFGVSGAIQHVEGIRDTKLFISVNRDKNAPIFNASDYGVTQDMKEILEELLKQLK